MRVRNDEESNVLPEFAHFKSLNFLVFKFELEEGFLQRKEI